MISEQFLLKRYTPPTCTLKIFTQKNFFPLWLKITPHQNLYFQMTIDDPRLPETEQITIQGDYHQLQILSVVVKNYTQKLLESSSIPIQPSPTSDITNLPQLQPQNLLNHQLVWDLLPTGKIKLNISQLFDIANILEQFQKESKNKFKFNKPTKIKQSLITVVGTASILFILFGIDKINFQKPQQHQTNPQPLLTKTPENNQEIIVIEPNIPQPIQPQPKLSPELTKYPEILPPNQIQSPQIEKKATTPITTPPTPTTIATIPTPTKSDIPESPTITPAPPKKSDSNALQEVKQYFQQRWLPPPQLTEKIEYRLTITPQGTVAEIIPIGRTSQFYLGRIKPSTQARIVQSPQTITDHAKIRLILTPHGLVQVFPETY